MLVLKPSRCYSGGVYTIRLARDTGSLSDRYTGLIYEGSGGTEMSVAVEVKRTSPLAFENEMYQCAPIKLV